MFGRVQDKPRRRIRWPAAAATTAVIIIGGTAASNIGADAASVSTITRDTGWKLTDLGKGGTYTGASTVLTFQLAAGVNADNIHGSAGKWQALVSGLPACTDTGLISFQQDREATPVPDPLDPTKLSPYTIAFNAIVKQAGMYLGDANAKKVELAWRIVMPERCKPDQPAAKVTTSTEIEKTCAGGFRELTATTTVGTVWDAAKWAWTDTDPKVEKTPFVKVRDLNPAELKELNCQKPDKPEVIITKEPETEKTCARGVWERVKTTTTTPSWVEAVWNWVAGEPVVTYDGDWTKVRDLNPSELSDLKCEKPKEPDVIVTKEPETNRSCAQGIRTRIKITTTGHVWKEAEWKWVLGEPVVTYTKWDKVRDLTPSEKADLGCDQPNPPADDVKTATKTWNDCKVIWSQVMTTTIKPVWDKPSWSWGKGTPVDSPGEVTKVRDLTEKERIDQGCVAKKVVEAPKANYPTAARTGGEAKNPFEVLVSSPSALAVFAAFLLGLAWVVRRRGSASARSIGR